MNRQYPASRARRAEETRCRHVTKHGPNAGQRCGNVAVFWQVGGNSCWRHGGDGPDYHAKFWAIFEKWHSVSGVYTPAPIRRLLELSLLNQEAAWQRRADARETKKAERTRAAQERAREGTVLEEPPTPQPRTLPGSLVLDLSDGVDERPEDIWDGWDVGESWR